MHILPGIYLSNLSQPIDRSILEQFPKLQVLAFISLEDRVGVASYIYILLDTTAGGGGGGITQNSHNPIPYHLPAPVHPYIHPSIHSVGGSTTVVAVR